MDDIIDEMVVEIRRLEGVIKTLKNCLIAAGISEGLVTSITTGAYSKETTFEEPVKKAPETWCLDTGIKILDPDGWDRKDYESWYTPITRDEFIGRARRSTCYAWPTPLYDE